MHFLAVEIAATTALLIGHFAAIVRNHFLPPKERPHLPAWKPIRPSRPPHALPAPCPQAIAHAWHRARANWQSCYRHSPDTGGELGEDCPKERAHGTGVADDGRGGGRTAGTCGCLAEIVGRWARQGALLHRE